jgi:branched-chain amino acid transport system permease protein
MAAVYFGMVLTIIAIVVARNLERSRMGRAWGAIREDETAAEMMGVNTVRTKLLAFALGASFAGVAGAFQASYLGATTSDFFQFTTSILVLIMVILGGIGNIWGVLAGAIVLIYIDKTFLIWLGQRFASVAPAFPNPSQFNFLIFGILLVVMMRFRPEGFLPSRQRAAELTLAGLQDAEAELGVEIETDNVEIAPHGQAELDRRSELPGEMEDE